MKRRPAAARSTGRALQFSARRLQWCPRGAGRFPARPLHPPQERFMLQRIALIAVIAVAVVGFGRAESPKPAADDKGKSTAFERLKKLAGEWSGKSDHEGT